MADAPLTHIFKFTVSKIASLITDWVLSEMDTFIPHKNTNKSLILSQPWFSPEYAAAAAFHRARKCHKVLRVAKISYAESVQARIEKERLGSREFWRITNKVLNLGKSPIPTIINGRKVISSSSDKAKLFASIFSSNSTLDELQPSLARIYIPD